MTNSAGAARRSCRWPRRVAPPFSGVLLGRMAAILPMRSLIAEVAMAARQWRIRRQGVAIPDALQRWDRAYQNLLRWSQLSERATREQADHASQPQQEVPDDGARGDLCP